MHNLRAAADAKPTSATAGNAADADLLQRKLHLTPHRRAVLLPTDDRTIAGMAYGAHVD